MSIHKLGSGVGDAQIPMSRKSGFAPPDRETFGIMGQVKPHLGGETETRETFKLCFPADRHVFKGSYMQAASEVSRETR